MECCEGLRTQNLLRSSCVSLEEVIQNVVELAFKDGCQERFQDIVSTLEKSMVKRAMELTKGNQVHAAKLLGISRNTLRKKLGEE
jgi:DNA-binding protein Fis